MVFCDEVVSHLPVLVDEVGRDEAEDVWVVDMRDLGEGGEGSKGYGYSLGMQHRLLTTANTGFYNTKQTPLQYLTQHCF